MKPEAYSHLVLVVMAIAIYGCKPLESPVNDMEKSEPVIEQQTPKSSNVAASTPLSVNGALSESGKVTLTAGDVSLELSASGCREETDTIQYCAGPVRLMLTKGGGSSQQIDLPSLYFDNQASVYRGVIDETYKLRGHSLILSDVNADGHQDLLVWSGKEGAYGGPSYDVYVFDPADGKFVHDQDFSDLTVGYNGLFFVEKDGIRAVSSEGCCLHVTDTYEIRRGKPVLVKRVTEDDGGGDGQAMKKVERLVNGEMKEVQE
ncbi:XAC2610-related protein [Solilutibacter pythonis]|uniref:XAC2610-related protein n=1 Tax=Solilutibacter pythonis TaxID=2483112 RepID=UPI0011C34739|nr:hypothetical protein [Lysobacter pythonis]